MAKIGGIIDKRNPFVRESWVNQGFGLTSNRSNRQAKLEKLFGKTVEEIHQFGDDNLGRYPAFVGIRWGFAEIRNNILTKTIRWENRFQYDEYGEFIGDRQKSQKLSIKRKTKNSGKASVNKNQDEFFFNTEEELVSSLMHLKNQIDDVKNRYFDYDLKSKNIDELMEFSVDKSIYRYFKHEKPSLRYRKWKYYANGTLLLKAINSISNQEDYDTFIYNLGESLVKGWGDRNDDGDPSKMNKGVGMKVINLISKHCYYSEYNSNHRIEYCLHVPWDKFTLQPIRKLFNKVAKEKSLPLIKNGQGMGYVVNLEIYKELHYFISTITEMLNIPRIYYEFMTWDKKH